MNLPVIPFYHYMSQRNIGDALACPRLYFKEWQHCPTYDFPSYKQGPAIIGGGGLLHDNTDRLWASFDHPQCVLWGVGTNYLTRSNRLYHDCLERFGLMGLRDWPLPTRADWVPCPSCLDGAFDTPRPGPIHDFVIYQHYGALKSDLKIAVDGPCMTNECCTGGLAEKLDFMATGKVIITQSHHGIYWAQLLNRGVLVWKANSTRFLRFKHPPVFCDETDWKEKLSLAQPPEPGFLQLCRSANLEFNERVKEFFTEKPIPQPTPIPSLPQTRIARRHGTAHIVK